MPHAILLPIAIKMPTSISHYRPGRRPTGARLHFGDILHYHAPSILSGMMASFYETIGQR